MKKMRKALLALLLSITVAGTSAAPVMAAGQHKCTNDPDRGVRQLQGG